MHPCAQRSHERALGRGLSQRRSSRGRCVGRMTVRFRRLASRRSWPIHFSNAAPIQGITLPTPPTWREVRQRVGPECPPRVRPIRRLAYGPPASRAARLARCSTRVPSASTTRMPQPFQAKCGEAIQRSEDHYSHIIPAMQADAAARIDAALPVAIDKAATWNGSKAVAPGLSDGLG
jgi:hypothetical protein